MHDGQTITDLVELVTKHVQKFGVDDLVASLELEYAAASPSLYLSDVLTHLCKHVMTAGDAQAWFLVRKVQDENWPFVGLPEPAAADQTFGGFPDVNTYRNFYLCNGRDDQ